MNKCDVFLNPLSDGCYFNMGAKEKKIFHQKLADHPECQQEFEAMKNTLLQGKKTIVPDPGQDYWDTFYDRLDQKLEDSKKNIIHWPALLRVAAILIAGFYIGYLVFDRNPDGPGLSENPTEAQQTALYKETATVLEDSKMLLLGIVNMDVDSGEDIDFSFQKKISGNLLKQTANLKDQLKNDKNRRVIQLLNDLELLLMQIANVEDDFDLPAIEVIQEGADKQSILFKINMERLLLDARQEHVKEKQHSEKSKL